MQIVIPTRGRTNQQLTLSYLPRELRKRTTLVCPEDEALQLSYENAGVEIVVQPDADWTIAQKRKWIIEEWYRAGYDRILMLDDDLTFATRVAPGDWRLRSIEGAELGAELQRLADKLGPEFPHVGFGPRQGNNRVEAGWKSPSRMMYSLGYYLPIVVKECELGRIETREDMDITLQLLRKGYPNAVWNTTVNDQYKYDAPGGATAERTVERSNADAYKLAELHRGYVRVEDRRYETSVPRKEVVCYWARALRDGIASLKRKEALASQLEPPVVTPDAARGRSRACGPSGF
jgi:hypothetical protein